MITLLSGTNRPDSKTRLVTKQIDAIYSSLGLPTGILDLIHLPSDLFLPSAYARKPDSFSRFTDPLLASDGLVVVTPEYNGSMPGILKFFIDMLPFPESFEKRPVCFVGLAAGRWGALRPVEQLQQIFGYRNAFIYPERVFLPEIHRLLDEAGNFTDAEVVKRLEAQATGFAKFIGKLQAPDPVPEEAPVEEPVSDSPVANP
jgi:NAD(P)H-dependent FMN reductase